MDDDQEMLPLDERFRKAEQFTLDLQMPRKAQPRTEAEDGSCPYHQTFVYECHYCNPR